MPKRRIGAILMAIGAGLTSAGAAMYVLPGPGLPILVVGLVALTVGLAVLAAAHRSRTLDPRNDKNPDSP